MNVSHRWLRALLPELPPSPQETAEILALRGAPVEEMTHLAPGLSGLVVGRVEGVEGHPDAERLSVCRVNTGAEILPVVCGAPNVRVGVSYPFAPVGSALPDGTRIEPVTIRGVESLGMLCSELELELGPDGSGVMALEGEFPPGAPLAEALGLDDWRLDVEVTANRGDLLSHVGVARELAPLRDGEVALPPFPGGAPVALRFERHAAAVTSRGVTIRIDDPDLCPRYLGAVIRGVRVGPSPAWLASRIRAAGSRPINNVVDATNYILLELGQPLHAFDLARISESTVVVRRAREGELIRTLDEEDRRLESGMLAICDAGDPVAIAGVMGGADSEVSEETTEVLLECALFDPKSIRSTRRALDLPTEASYRFERGVDPEGMELALRRAVEVIVATAGGGPDPEVLDVCPRPWPGLTVPLRPSRVKRLLGVGLEPRQIEELLAPLGFRITGSGEDLLEVAIPGFRSYDVTREVDVVEEVARAFGYDRFPDELGPFRPGSVPDHPLFRLEDTLRDLLVGRGFLEAQTQAFASEGEVELSNPVSVQERFLRNRLLPGLVRRLEYNFARGQRDVRLFELGTVFFDAGEGRPPREELRLAVILTGTQRPMHWDGEARESDLWDVKGLLDLLARGAGGPGIELRDGAGAEAGIMPGEGFTAVDPEGGVLGLGGRIPEDRVDAPAWAGPIWGIEITLPEEPKARRAPVYRPPPPFPRVERDLALLLPKGLPARQVESLIRETAGSILTDLAIFDLYEGEGVGEGHRSVAFRLWLQSRERTLTDEDVERAMRRVTDRLREELGVNVRG